MVLDRKEWKAEAIYYPKLKVRSSGLNSTVTDLFSFDPGTGKILLEDNRNHHRTTWKLLDNPCPKNSRNAQIQN